MKPIYFVLFFSLICAAAYAQNENVSENRTIDRFDKIQVCCGIDLYISEGNSSTLTVETNYAEYLPMVKTEVKKGELNISFNLKNQIKRPNKMWIKVTLAANNLTAITASSGSDVISKTPLTADEIKIAANSGADIKIELQANHLECATSSGSDIKLTGKAAYALLKASSGGDLNLRNMTVGSVEASSSTGSDIVVSVTDEIHAKASTGASIRYKGNPQKVNKKKSLGGDIRSID